MASRAATRPVLAASGNEPVLRVTSRGMGVKELLVASSVLSLRIDRGELTMDQAVRQLTAALKAVRS